MSEQPAPALAHEEQHRGENLALRVQELRASTGEWTVDLYQASARNAFENAAAHTEQPDDGWRR
ncbi:hypothetical protein DV517_62010 [Streptomyces sp. S816]|uniref:hypothetical protein n=1 Tax=Streptomyces sp. S816 TaxID=2283197 RepID=UPI00109C5FEF|nr:hypothetical protein [Streptomyces sp. S816]TGZ14718.1 hypothetical protein DV517_62010 [Streptomyces sp. S816]